MIEPDEISTTPRPGPPIAPTNASNSEKSLIVEGIGTPPQPEWFSEYEAPMPIAPWSIASATSRFISASSAAVGSLRSEASSLIIPSTTARLRMIRSRRCGGDGTIPKPQLPMIAVVTPSEGDGDSVGSQVTWAS